MDLTFWAVGSGPQDAMPGRVWTWPGRRPGPVLRYDGLSVRGVWPVWESGSDDW